MGLLKNSDISIIPRLLLNGGVQFGIAGLGIGHHWSVFCGRKNFKHLIGIQDRMLARQQWGIKLFVLSYLDLLYF